MIEINSKNVMTTRGQFALVTAAGFPSKSQCKNITSDSQSIKYCFNGL